MDLAAGAIDPSWPPPLGSAEGDERRRRGRGRMVPLRPASPQSRARRGRREEEGRGRGWQVGPGANGLFTSLFS